MVGIRKAADLEDFAVDEIGDLGSIGRNREAAFVAVEGGEFLVRVAEDIEILQARRPGHGMILFDRDGGIHSGEPGDVAKGAAFVGRRKGAGGKARGFDGEERKSRHGLGEVSDGVVVGKKGGVGGFEKEVVAFVDADFVSGVVEKKGLHGVAGVAAVVLHGSGQELDEQVVAVGRPANGIGQVAEELVAARVFLTFEKAVALAVGFLEPDVVVLEVVELGLEPVINGKRDGVVGAEGKGGDFGLDGAEGIVEVLSAGGD